MTLKRMMTTVVVATPVGSPPPYARLGQGVMGGTIAAMVEGDAVDAKLLLDELQHVFGTEFDRGELTVENLRPVLWAAHWLKSVRPVAQRASELLTLAADRAFEPGSKAAKDCQAVAQVMGSVAITEPHCLTAIEAARKIRVPADFYAAEAKSSGLAMFGPGDNNEQIIPMVRKPGGLELTEASALRADGIRPTALLTSEETQVLAEQISSTADAVRALGAELTELDAQGADGAGSTVVADDSPFRLYQFAHEMHELLKRINTKVAGRDAVYSHGMQPSEQMLAEADSAMEAVWVLLDKIAGRGPMEMDPESAAAIEGMIKQAAHQERQANAVELEQAIGQLKKLVAPDDQAALNTTSIIEQRVRERAQRRYQREVLEAFHAFRQFCGPFAPVINGKPHEMNALLTELEQQCYQQGKERAGNNAVEYLASTIAYRLEDLLGGAK